MWILYCLFQYYLHVYYEKYIYYYAVWDKGGQEILGPLLPPQLERENIFPAPFRPQLLLLLLLLIEKRIKYAAQHLHR